MEEHIQNHIQEGFALQRFFENERLQKLVWLTEKRTKNVLEYEKMCDDELEIYAAGELFLQDDKQG